MSNVLEKLHQVQTEMALEIDRVCKKHDIKYFIVAGTLLGAVRHKGFIPWDDDLDIGMLREEYDKFIEVAKTELKKNYYLQTWDSDPGFGWPFAKLRKKNTTFIEANSLDTTAHQGIFVDIFPFDNVPVSSMKKKQHNFTALVLKKALLLKQGYTIWDEKDTVKKYAHLILKSASKPINAETIKRTLYKVMTKYNLHQSNYIVNFGGAYGYSKETIDYAWVETLDTIEFDGYTLACPNDTDAYLTHMYGDYMTPPPEEKRYNRHNIIEVKF